MFTAMEPPSEQQLAAFNIACCRRIRHLITDSATFHALDTLECATDYLTVATAVALAANQIGASSEFFNPASPMFNPSRNTNAARALAHAVCRSLPPGSFYYWQDPVDNARLVALYCQWAVAWAADSDRDVDEENYLGGSETEEMGLGWLRQRAEQDEALAQCNLIRGLFTRQVTSGSS